MVLPISSAVERVKSQRDVSSCSFRLSLIAFPQNFLAQDLHVLGLVEPGQRGLARASRPWPSRTPLPALARVCRRATALRWCWLRVWFLRSELCIALGNALPLEVQEIASEKPDSAIGQSNGRFQFSLRDQFVTRGMLEANEMMHVIGAYDTVWHFC